MATPTFETELAIRMTVNARLANTPQRGSAPMDGFDPTLDWLDKGHSAHEIMKR